MENLYNLRLTPSSLSILSASPSTSISAGAGAAVSAQFGFYLPTVEELLNEQN